VIEHQLGFELPSQYKAFVETFGYGAVDGAIWPTYFRFGARLLMESHRVIAAEVVSAGGMLPYRIFPERGGVFFVGRDSTARAVGFMLAGDDPEHWPIVLRDGDDWVAFDGGYFDFWLTLLRDWTLLGDEIDDRALSALCGSSFQPAESRLRGRTAELAALHAMWARASAGETRAVLISGDAGIGKTRLAAELIANVASPETAVVAGRCDAGDPRPYRPWSEVFDTVQAMVGPDTLLGWAGDLAPLLETLLGRPRRARLPSQVSDTTADDRIAVYELAGRLLRKLADGRPLLVVLEDVHWADDATVAVLHHLVGHWVDEPCLFVLTVRADEPVGTRRQTVSSIGSLKGMERLPLHGLDRSATAQLIADRSAGPPDPDLIDLVFEQTDGSPFFCEELLSVLATDATPADRQRPASPLSVPVPETVREAVLVRVEQLDREARHVLDVAAVIGTTFDPQMIADVTGVATSAVRAALRVGVEQRLVEPTGAEPDSFAFRHALTRAALLGELPDADQAALHSRIARALELTGSAPPGIIADHREASDSPDAAVASARCRLDAALVAEVTFAFGDAARQCSAALATLDRANLSEHELRYDLLSTSARVLDVLARVEEGGEAAFSATRVALDLGDTDRFVQAALALPLPLSSSPDPRFTDTTEQALQRLGDRTCAERADLLARSAFRALAEDSERARLGVEAAWSMAEDLDDSGAMVRVGLIRWLVSYGLVDRETLRSIERDAIAAADRFRRQTGRDHRYDLELRGWAAVGHLLDGDRDSFSLALDRLSADADRSAHHGVVRVIYGRATLALLDGDVTEVSRCIDASEHMVMWDPLTSYAIRLGFGVARDAIHGRWLKIAERAEPMAKLPGHSGVRAVVAAAYANAGAVDDARETFDQLLDEGLGHVVRNSVLGIGPLTIGWLVDLTCTLRDRTPVPELLELLEPHRGSLLCGCYGLYPLHAADVYRGRLLSLTGRHDEAIAAFEQGIALEVRLRARPLLVRSRHWLARALHVGDDTGARQRAGTLVDEALRDARATRMTEDIAGLETLAANL
jgi:hypothetical protein